ncbi:MAG: tail protein X [Oscillospiraceae bacterium]|jgi:phage tail protein X|nr:tail protein X [Oscillospiraceae bacterium]
MQKNQFYRTLSGDTWDGVAFKTLGSEMLKDTLMKANPRHLHYYIFPAGVVLDVPAVEIPATTDLPPWRKS